jgi:diadenosine tetraphosphate (Ap4A) HIT family hydrolase
MGATHVTARFDFILNPQASGRPAIENTVLFETRFFAVVPSLGSLVPGWLLLVPKRSVLNCSMLTDGEIIELESLVGQLSIIGKRFPGRVYAFEHGASRTGSLTGCGVDHAHMHLVPLEFDLLAAALETPGVVWNEPTHGGIAKQVTTCKEEYVAVYDIDRELGILGRPSGQCSQWVRKIIASKLNRSNEWDYHTAPQRNIIAATIEGLKSLSIEGD